MLLADLLPAIQRIESTPFSSDLRVVAYLQTYPHILSLASSETEVTIASFLKLAAMAYGWMPRVLRLESAHIPCAISALQTGATSTPQNIRSVAVKDLANCLHSVVGASKMLHFVNPGVFPIWDRKIESLRLGHDPSQFHMDKISNYLSFVDEVHTIRIEAGFTTFYADFQRAYSARQAANKIAVYTITEVRAIEAAAFELA